MINNSKVKTRHFTRIHLELEKAEKKHPKFCDCLTYRNLEGIKDALDYLRERNSESITYADSILGEEILEAFEAYKQGEKEHCLQELAQCGAVILRMMQFVHDEMEAGK